MSPQMSRFYDLSDHHDDHKNNQDHNDDHDEADYERGGLDPASGAAHGFKLSSAEIVWAWANIENMSKH